MMLFIYLIYKTYLLLIHFLTYLFYFVGTIRALSIRRKNR